MTAILNKIIESKHKGEKLLAILLDPDKIEMAKFDSLIQKINQSPATHIFVGGSVVQNNIMENVILELKIKSTLPVILFPGHPSQISDKADGILFLNLISGRNPDYLIEHQVQSVPLLKKSKLQIIPTAYILVDGGTKSAVELVSETKPLSQKNRLYICQTAQAGELMGNQLVYLEAGSGAKNPVLPKVIQIVSKHLKCPLIVGGGLTTKKSMDQAYKNGADMVVIGTAFENDHLFFENIKTL